MSSDRRSWLGRVTKVLIGTLSLSACTWNRAVPAYLVNASLSNLKIAVSMPVRLEPTSDLSTCQFDPQRQPMTIGDLAQVRQQRVLLWPTVELNDYDSAKCSANILVPPGKAVLMYWDGTCSDYERRSSVPPKAPTLDRLQITGDEQSVVLTGFDTARAFKASAWHRDCRFVIK